MKRKHPSPTSLTSANKRLTEKSVSDNPYEQFLQWLKTAEKRKIPHTNAMALATATVSGVPSVRIVLLKGIDGRGVSFYTNFDSRKGLELSENPRAALLFFWPQMERQVRIEGTVEKLSREESFEYFKTRPRKSRIGAWASRQSEIIKSRSILEKRFGEFENRFQGAEVPLPEHWGGFRLKPVQFEFWQGRTNRLHDRIAYMKAVRGWRIVRLSP